MITVRKGQDRGFFNHGWLETYHTFSFGDYRDPRHRGYRHLRVLNEDRVAPGKGFEPHAHQDMEILTYILEGTLSHKDSMGNGSSIPAGEVQYMSAGTGVTHSEFNHNADQWVHLIQVWIFPNQKSLAPRYNQLHLSTSDVENRLKLVASEDGRNGSIAIRQDADLYVCRLNAQQSVTQALRSRRGLWLQVLRGELRLNNELLMAGDGASVEEESNVTVTSTKEAEFLLFDLS